MSVIEVGGLAVHYNAPRGIPYSESEHLLMLVHGAGGSSRHWEPIMAILGSEVFPVAVDLPGHGATDGYVLDSIEAVAQFLYGFLHALEVKRPVCYVGHSVGGLIGLHFALSYPTKVERLVLIATAARIQLHPDFLLQALSNNWDMTFLRQSFAPEIPEEVKELVLSEFHHARFRHDTAEGMGISQIDLTKAISALRLPTLILSGDDDVIISPRKSVVLHQQIAGSHLVNVLGGGHYLHVEQPKVAATEIMGFLMRSPLSSR